MEVCVGHIVIPQEVAHGCNADSPTETTHEPSVKRTRHDVANYRCQPLDKKEHSSCYSVSNDVVSVAKLSVKSLRDALRRYALDRLERDGAGSSGNHPNRIALEAIQAWSKEASAQWPVVVSPKPSSSSLWVTWSFCFVPLVLDQNDGDNKEVSTTQGRTTATSLRALGEAALKTLAAIPLPRKAQILGSAGSGCISAVLSERVSLPDGTSSVPAPHADQEMVYPPSSRLSTELASKPLLLVGAGGIGCEVLKVLVLSGFTCIHLIDLDTIDATNLNRQFLFQLPDVGHSKAETACRVVLEWFSEERHADLEPSTNTHRQAPHIVAYHDNIKAKRFDDAFYRQFVVVLNALDNVAARQHVNRMCMRNAIPLIESGTMGYNGQVQPIVKGTYECYDCRPKPPDRQTFAVCTIHARPTTVVHCVHYAKELYEVLFGSTAGDETSSSDAAKAATATDVKVGVAVNEEDKGDAQAHDSSQRQGGESELSYLQALVSEWREQGQYNQKAPVPALDHVKLTPSAALLGAQLLRHLFVDKIEELLTLKSSWPTEPPAPLNRSEVERVVAAHERALASSQSVPLKSLPVDEVLSLSDCMELFERAVAECLHRPPGASFKKDDDAAVRFVSATANLRAHVFHIEQRSLEEVRSIAGSIVPAIATTNAIIAAAVVHELVALMQSAPATAHEKEAEEGEKPPGSVQQQPEARAAVAPHVVYARKAPQTRRRRLPAISSHHHLSPSLYATLTPHNTSPHDTERPRSVVDAYLVHSTCPNPPNSLHCCICQDVHPEVVVQLNLESVTLGRLVHSVLEDVLHLEGPSVSHGATMLYEDEDYETLADNTLAGLLRPSVATAEQHNTHAANAEPHRFVLTADALNKEVAWSVVLVDARQTPNNDSVGTTRTISNVDGEEAQRVDDDFTVSGLKQAQAAEQHALARLGEQRRLQEEEEGEKESTADHHRESAANSYALPSTAEVIISDDDANEVEEMAGGNTTKSKPFAAESVERDGDGDAVIVVDD